ncbi:MAG: hypothetical protein K2X48_13720 [Chitinophagaceae bacterium]|nr:hypothetical protein [Chitinophagaceae bacterium]
MNPAVASVDIVQSSKLSAAKRRRLLAVIKKCMHVLKLENKEIVYEVSRGDSIQLLWKKKSSEALRQLLWLHMMLLQEGFEMRTGFGIGKISLLTKSLSTSDGTAFQLSGRCLDAIKNADNRIAIAFETDELNKEWAVHNVVLNYVLQRTTAPQAVAIARMLENKTQQQVAKVLRIKQPSVHQRLKAGGWVIIQAAVNRYQQIQNKAD